MPCGVRAVVPAGHPWAVGQWTTSVSGGIAGTKPAGLLGCLLAALLVTGCSAGSDSSASDSTATVRHVVDGDTLVLDDGVTVRLIGIDTPERGACGSRQATRALEDLVEGRSVTLVNPSGVQDEDRFERLLRYVDVEDVDVGLRQIEQGHAAARYDGRDGYDAHPREDDYRAADAATPRRCR